MESAADRETAAAGGERRANGRGARSIAFILAALEAQGLQPAPEADRWTLARRLSFALTGLPPSAGSGRAVCRRSLRTRPTHELVRSLLDDPHFGERWARHWMDVVHYSDTHGYEWDMPAKNAWMYRDYLVRAFNADVPFRQLVLEQIAGDLVEPRVEPPPGSTNRSIGPMALRLGERRHGDNAEVRRGHAKAMTNVIDTLTKGFLGHDRRLCAMPRPQARRRGAARLLRPGRHAA